MKLWELESSMIFHDLESVDLAEDGIIVPNVNTTVDVQPGETERQAEKFGNKLLKDGTPPLIYD